MTRFLVPILGTIFGSHFGGPIKEYKGKSPILGPFFGSHFGDQFLFFLFNFGLFLLQFFGPLCSHFLGPFFAPKSGPKSPPLEETDLTHSHGATSLVTNETLAPLTPLCVASRS